MQCKLLKLSSTSQSLEIVEQTPKIIFVDAGVRDPFSEGTHVFVAAQKVETMCFSSDKTWRSLGILCGARETAYDFAGCLLSAAFPAPDRLTSVDKQFPSAVRYDCPNGELQTPSDVEKAVCHPERISKNV